MEPASGTVTRLVIAKRGSPHVDNNVFSLPCLYAQLAPIRYNSSSAFATITKIHTQTNRYATMASNTARKEPACPQRPVLTLNNAHGEKLHIVDPGVYTKDELVWLQQGHNSKEPSDKVEIVHQETYAPSDPRTAALDGLLRQICKSKLRNPNFETPEFFNEDMRRVAEELRKHKEVWEPEPQQQARET